MFKRTHYIGHSEIIIGQQNEALLKLITSFENDILKNYDNIILDISINYHDRTPIFTFRPKHNWFLIGCLFPFHIIFSILYLRKLDDYLDDIEYTGKFKPEDIQKELARISNNITELTNLFSTELKKLNI